MTPIEVLCPICHGETREVHGKNGVFLSCVEYPSCKGTVDIGPDGTPAPICPADSEHGHMRFFKSGKRGPWFGCRAYPNCRETRDAAAREPGEGG